jgi:hypothetical protein
MERDSRGRFIKGNSGTNRPRDEHGRYILAPVGTLDTTSRPSLIKRIWNWIQGR